MFLVEGSCNEGLSDWEASSSLRPYCLIHHTAAWHCGPVIFWSRGICGIRRINAINMEHGNRFSSIMSHSKIQGLFKNCQGTFRKFFQHCTLAIKTRELTVSYYTILFITVINNVLLMWIVFYSLDKQRFWNVSLTHPIHLTGPRTKLNKNSSHINYYFYYTDQ